MNEIDLLREYRTEVSGPDPETAQAARSRLTEAIERERAQRRDEPRAARLGGPGNARLSRRRLALAAAVVLVAIGMVLALTLGGSSSGPARALAIDKTPKWVTLRLTNPNASDAQMNQELANAGIDRVRVHSVPGSPKAVGTWAGYVEVGIQCQDGANRFGYDVDIPTVKNFNRNTKHGAEGQFDVKVPRRTGRVVAEEVGTPGSKSVVRIPTDSINDPRNALKVLVPIRPRSPNDTAASNDINTDQLIGFGGLFAQYGQAIESGQASCGDFGLKPYPKPTWPPSGNGWVVIHVTPSAGGARKMTRELRAGGVKGQVRQIPVEHGDVGHVLGWTRVPPLPKNAHAHGNKADIAPNEIPHVHGPTANDIALRRSAFNAYPNARWIFYVGRRTHSGEAAKVVGLNGIENAKAALRKGCPGLGKLISANGEHKRCIGALSTQVPRP